MLKSFNRLSKDNMCNTLLVAGQQGRGKTYRLLKELDDVDPSILWLSTNNTRGLYEVSRDWLHCEITDWNTFNNAYNLIISGDDRYSAIVIDTLDDLLRCALNDARQSKAPIGILTQSDYLLCTEEIVTKLRRLFRYTDRLYCSVNIAKDSSGNLVLSVNRDFYNKTLSLFTDRWVCVTKTRKGATEYDIVKNLTKMSEYSPS